MEEFFVYFLAYKYLVYLIVLSLFVGIEVVSNIPVLMHTPLMSGSNAIHGIVIIGGILILGQAKEEEVIVRILGFVSVILGSMNVIGGFLITDRMLKLYKNTEK